MRRPILLQICNAGFVVSPNHRGGGYGTVLGKSYLHYGPKLGYRASVFNLVYVNNVASVRRVFQHEGGQRFQDPAAKLCLCCTEYGSP
jgi:GNAT superfamily N-acetyltransferase